MKPMHGLAALVALLIAIIVSHPAPSLAHCDGLDGPVVTAARAALERGDPNLVLVWVRKEDESEIRGAFDRTLSVRKLGPQARELADTYFFETLVRVHRAGEGEPFTGLKPAGRDLGPAIPAADRALESGNAEALTALIGEAVHAGLGERYHAALALKTYPAQDLDAGRRYVAAYVAFVHHVERLYQAATAAHTPHGEGVVSHPGSPH